MLPTKKSPPKQDHADLTVLVYGPSKIGKSTGCSRSEGALFLATEPGLNSLDVFQVPIRSWEELLAACGEIAEGLFGLPEPTGEVLGPIAVNDVDLMNIPAAAVHHGFGRFANRPCSVSEWK